MQVSLETTVLPANKPAKLLLHLSDVESDVTGVVVTIMRIGELRDDWVFGTNAKLKKGKAIECEIELSSFEPGLYQVAEVTPDKGGSQTIILGEPAVRRVDLYFIIDDGSLGGSDPADLASKIYEQRTNKHRAQLITNSASKFMGASAQYKAIIFFSGVPLHHVQQLKVCVIRPVVIGLGLASLNEVVATHLKETLGHPVGFDQLADTGYRADNPLFAVHLDNLAAIDLSDALNFVLNYSIDVATIIGVERGERPIRCAVYISNGEGFSLYPITDAYRGNILSPMFKNEQAALIERYLPVLSKSRRAKLDLELYIQALAERDSGFQYFRYWAVLEMIAARQVPSDKIKIKNPDGSFILGPVFS